MDNPTKKLRALCMREGLLLNYGEDPQHTDATGIPGALLLRSIRVWHEHGPVLMLNPLGGIYDIPDGVTSLDMTSVTFGHIPTSVEKLIVAECFMQVPHVLDRLTELCIRSMRVPPRVLCSPNLVELHLFEARGVYTLHVPRTLRKLSVHCCDDLLEVTGMDEVSAPVLDCTFRKCKNLIRVARIRAAEYVEFTATPSLKTLPLILEPSATKHVRLIEPGDAALSGHSVLDAASVDLVRVQGAQSLHLGPRTRAFTAHECHNLASITHETGVMDEFRVSDMPRLTHVGLTKVTSGSRPDLCEGLSRATVRMLEGHE